MSDDHDDGYFDMSEALDDFTYSADGAKEKTISGLKIVGKGLFNTLKYTAVVIVPAMMEQAVKTGHAHANTALKNDELTDAQRQKMEAMRDRSAEFLTQKEKQRQQLPKK